MTKKNKYITAITFLILVLIAVFMPTIFAQEQVVNQQEEVNEARVDQGLSDENKDHESSSDTREDEVSTREKLESSQTNEPSESDSNSELDETFVEEQVTSQTITVYNGLRLVQPKLVESDFTGQLIVEIDPTSWSNATKHLSLEDQDRAWRSMIQNDLTLSLDGQPYMKAPMNDAGQAIFNITQPFKEGSVVSITSPLSEFLQGMGEKESVTSYIDTINMDILIPESDQKLMLAQEVDVVTAVSTTAIISKDYIKFEKEIERTDTSISGWIDDELIYKDVLDATGWDQVPTNKFLLDKAIIDNGTLVLTSDNVNIGTVDIDDKFYFKFENLDLSNLGSVMFELDNINFDGLGTTPVTSKLIFGPIMIDFVQPPSPPIIAKVPETIAFQPTAFSFDLANKKIKLTEPFQVEIKATSEADKWSLMVDSSGELNKGTQSIEHMLYYNDENDENDEKVITTEASLVKVGVGSSEIEFGIDSFQLTILEPDKLNLTSRNETYSTQINWTLVVGSEE